MTSLSLEQVHCGKASEVHATRQIILNRAYTDCPERFDSKVPGRPQEPTAVWINPVTQRLQPQA
jgi:hypothetical protein